MDKLVDKLINKLVLTHKTGLVNVDLLLTSRFRAPIKSRPFYRDVRSVEVDHIKTRLTEQQEKELLAFKYNDVDRLLAVSWLNVQRKDPVRLLAHKLRCKAYRNMPAPMTGMPGEEMDLLQGARKQISPTAFLSCQGLLIAFAAAVLMPNSANALDAWVAPTAAVADPLLNIAQFAFIIRIVLSWYPEMDINQTPWNLVAWPTEPVLNATRQVLPPAFGVDVSPVFWFALLSFLHEIVFGPQGLYYLVSRQ